MCELVLLDLSHHSGPQRNEARCSMGSNGRRKKKDLQTKTGSLMCVLIIKCPDKYSRRLAGASDEVARTRVGVALRSWSSHSTHTPPPPSQVPRTGMMVSISSGTGDSEAPADLLLPLSIFHFSYICLVLFDDGNNSSSRFTLHSSLVCARAPSPASPSILSVASVEGRRADNHLYFNTNNKIVRIEDKNNF